MIGPRRDILPNQYRIWNTRERGYIGLVSRRSDGSIPFHYASPPQKDRLFILVLYRTSKEVVVYPGIVFWKVLIEDYGLVYIQEANLEQNTVVFPGE